MDISGASGLLPDQTGIHTRLVLFLTCAGLSTEKNVEKKIQDQLMNKNNRSKNLKLKLLFFVV